MRVRTKLEAPRLFLVFVFKLNYPCYNYEREAETVILGKLVQTSKIGNVGMWPGSTDYSQQRTPLSVHHAQDAEKQRAT